MQLPRLASYIVAVTISLSAPALMSPKVLAAPPGFELDLKDLKKPAAPPVTPKKTVPAPKTQKKPAAATAAAKKPVGIKKPARVAVSTTKPVVSAVTPKPADDAAQQVFLDGTSACPLARQLLEAVAEPVPAEELLQLISLPVATAARYQGLTAVLVCGLPPAEAYTFRRLITAHEVQLIALAGDEQPAQVIQAVAQGLGLSYRHQQDSPASYLTSDAQGHPLRLTVNSGTAP